MPLQKGFPELPLHYPRSRNNNNNNNNSSPASRFPLAVLPPTCCLLFSLACFIALPFSSALSSSCFRCSLPSAMVGATRSGSAKKPGDTKAPRSATKAKAKTQPPEVTAYIKAQAELKSKKRAYNQYLAGGPIPVSSDSEDENQIPVSFPLILTCFAYNFYSPRSQLLRRTNPHQRPAAPPPSPISRSFSTPSSCRAHPTRLS